MDRFEVVTAAATAAAATDSFDWFLVARSAEKKGRLFFQIIETSPVIGGYSIPSRDLTEVRSQVFKMNQAPLPTLHIFRGKSDMSV